MYTHRNKQETITRNHQTHLHSMASEKEIIVALELATTSIRAIAGQRLADGTMQILAYSEESANNCIRKGIIDNIDKTTQAISRVLGQISLQLGRTVSRVYVGLGGQSLHTILNPVQRTFAEKTQITAGMIDQLIDTNRGVVYTDSKILEVIPQEYKVGNRPVLDVVGMQVDQLEARFLNVVARTTLSENIEKCVRGAGLDIAELLIAPLTLADTQLSASEKRSGCALVDIGADTTTISIYTNNILRKLTVIPLGGHNITNDISTCLTVEHDEAENLKIRWGSAWLNDRDKARSNTIKLSHERDINEESLCEIVEARTEEILMNIWKQIEQDIEKLTSGIVFVGGGAQMRSLAEAFQNYTSHNKHVRFAKGLPSDVTTKGGQSIADNGRMYTIMSLLVHGDQNCVRTESTIVEPGPSVSAEPDPIPEDNETQALDNVSQETKPTNKKKFTSKLWEVIKASLTDE